MSPEDGVRVQHILDAAREAVAFAQGQTFESPEAGHMRSLAIVRLMEIISEAATTMSPELKAAHPEIPWRIMAASRNRLIHAYFNVNLRIVLDTTQVDLPPLIADMEALMNNETSKHQDIFPGLKAVSEASLSGGSLGRSTLCLVYSRLDEGGFQVAQPALVVVP